MTQTQIAAMGPEDLDEAIVRLTGKPFIPNMGLAGRRRVLWREVCRQRALKIANQPDVRSAHPNLNRPPLMLQRRPPYDEVLERTLLFAARAGLPIGDACNITEAHLLGEGIFVDDILRLTVTMFARLNTVYGWGLRQYPDGTVEVYS